MKIKKLIGALCALFFSSAPFAAQISVKYSYDGLNRLTNETYLDGTAISYTYDATGNRLSRIVTKSVPKVAETKVKPQQIVQAMQKLQQALLSHPEWLVSERLFSWIASDSVRFATNIFPEMRSSLEMIKGEEKVMLSYNVTYILNMPDVKSPEDKKVLLWLILYREAVRIDDHFSGIPLTPLIPAGPVSEEKAAQRMWDMEWRALTEEWKLAKRLEKPYLIPVIHSATRDGENSRTFIEGFYQLLMISEAVKLNPSLSAGLTSRYKEELAKLSSENLNK